MLAADAVEILSCVDRHRHIYLLRQRKKLSQKLILHGCETGKAIQRHHAALQDLRLARHLAERLQRFLRRDVFSLQLLLEAFVEKLDILQLIKEGRLLLRPLQKPLHLLRVDIILRQLRDHGFHLLQISHLFQISF